jgi:hypothetical protein
VQIRCFADADVIRTRFKKRAETDSRHVTRVEGEEGHRNLETHIERGAAPLDVDGEIINVDSTDFSRIDQADIIKQLREVLKDI